MNATNELVAERDLSGGDYVVSALFTCAPDPTNSSEKVGVGGHGADAENALGSVSPARLYDYMRPWYESLHLHPGLRGLVLYDRLPAGFVERWSSRQVSFQPFRIPEPFDRSTSVYIQRMLALQACLGGRPDIARIWFTDINDVGFVVNPFEWMDRLPFGDSWLFAGEEWTTFRNSAWWGEKANHFKGEYLDLFSGRLADMYLVNAGVWGGHRTVVLEVLQDFVAEVERLLGRGFDLRAYPGGSADMPILNLLLYGRFFPRLVTFKLEAHAGQLVFESGAFVRSAGNPVIHHRPAALKVSDELRAEQLKRTEQRSEFQR